MITKITHFFQSGSPQPVHKVAPPPPQKNWLEETQHLSWTSAINLETLSLGAISCCFDFSPEQIVLLLLSMKVTALMIPVLIPTIAPEIFLMGAGALLATLILLLLATMIHKGYCAAKQRAAAQKAAEEAAKRAAAQKSWYNPKAWLASIGATFITLT